MPYENFLVNEPRLISRRKPVKRIRKNILGEELMILGNPRKKKSLLSSFLGKPQKSRSRVKKLYRNIAEGFYDSMGAFHSIRASKHKKTKIKDYDYTRAGEKKPKKRRPKISKALKGRKFKRIKLKKGGVEEMAKKKRKHVKRNEPKRRHRKLSFRRNEPKRRRRRASFRRNEPKRRKKHFRRNAPAVATVGGLSITKPMTWLPLMATAGVGAIVTGKVPTYVGAGDSPLWRYGSMMVSAFGGGWLVGRFVGKNYGYAWLLGSGAIIMSDVISTYVLKQVGISGLAEDLGNTGAYPYAEIGAYPYSEMAGYPYAEVGAYPYEYA